MTHSTPRTLARPTLLAAAPLALWLAGAPALAQSNVTPANKYSWSENCGWMNWRDGGAPAGAQGARLYSTYLSGFVWGEHLGWVNLGNGPPAGGVSYANVSGETFGVNRHPTTGVLSGFAWCENFGWINFSGGAMATPANPARYDSVSRRLRGFAWGENFGWINLDDGAAFVGFCLADFDGDGLVQSADIAVFVTTWFASLQNLTLAGDFDGNGVVESADIGVFVSAWFNALSSGSC